MAKKNEDPNHAFTGLLFRWRFIASGEGHVSTLLQRLAGKKQEVWNRYHDNISIEEERRGGSL